MKRARETKAQEAQPSEDAVAGVVAIHDFLTKTELLAIFGGLKAKDILSIASVCQLWSGLVQNEALWMAKCIADREVSWNCPSMTWKQLYFQDSGFFKSLCKHLGAVDDSLMPLGMAMLEYTGSKKSHQILCSVSGCLHDFPKLWMCTKPGCHHVGCSRRDGKHALEHYELTNHPLFIKLNTLELWCHVCVRWVGKSTHPNPVEAHRVNTINNYLLHLLPDDHVVKLERTLNERRVKERILDGNGKKRNRDGPVDGIHYVIPAQWQREWERFKVGDSPPPGVMDLNSFFQPSGWFKSPFPEFGIVAPHVWEYMKTVYTIRGCIAFRYRKKLIRKIQVMGQDGELEYYDGPFD